MKKVILSDGLPGSGKSTWAKQILNDNPNSYKRINNDTIKNPKKAEKLCLSLLQEGKSIVIDNMNAQPKTRSVYIEMAKKLKIQVRAIYMQTDKETCLYNNSLRKVEGS